MNILAFADLHMQGNCSYELRLVKDIVDKANPDVILIAGDIYESNIFFNPYKDLASLGKTVICCFGNHEFAYKSVNEVIKYYKEYYNPMKYDVHYLDIVGHVKIDDVNFVGNVLWYDGSLKNYPNQSDVIYHKWLDSTIKDFDWKTENMKCTKQIRDNYDRSCKNVLLTHCVPNMELNLFSYDSVSQANFYSGMSGFLNDLDDEGIIFDHVICGHTHRYVNTDINGQRCVNIGNDYLSHGIKIKYYMFEV